MHSGPPSDLLVVETPAQGELSEAGRRLVFFSAIGLVGLYLALFAAGIRFFVFKTAVLALLLVYALAVRNRLAFVVDWLPLLSITVLFDAIRGSIYIPIRPASSCSTSIT